MKPVIVGIIVLCVGLFAPRGIQAQGTLYLSSLSQTSTGSAAVGSNSWFAEDVLIGNTQAPGYVLNSIQLGMANASGSPGGFTVMLYSDIGQGGAYPGSSLVAFVGSINPAIGGVYTYTPTENITLLRDSDYFIVLTAGTAVADGAYTWSDSAYPPNVVAGGWEESTDLQSSTNGASDSWSLVSYSGIPQLALYVTPTPEPGTCALLAFGAAAFGFNHWRRKTQVGNQ